MSFIDYFLKRSRIISKLITKSKEHNQNIHNNSLEIAELKGMMKVREQVREPTPRTSIEKKIKQSLNNAKLMKAIHSCIKEGYSTNRIKEDILTRFGIKKTCFFKYLKLVREQVREPTPRTTQKN